MLKLYQSNDIESLKFILLELLQKKNNNHNNSHISELIIIPNHNISFILKLFFAKYLGVCANYKFILPAKFIWNIYRLLIPNVLSENIFNKNNLTFIIMELLPSLLNKKEFAYLKKYLGSNILLEKLFYLSMKIADVYDKYLIYRINWLLEWEKFNLINNIKDNGNQVWQAILWRKIVHYYSNNINYCWHRAHIYYEFLNSIKKKNKYIFKNIIPQEIYVFNVTLIPNIYLQSFYILSKYININYFIINPSFSYWYDNYLDNKDYLNLNNTFKRTYFFSKYKNFHNNMNSFVLYYGKSLADYLNIILELDIYKIDVYLKLHDNTILNKLKNNILYFQDLYFFNDINNLPKDDSILINSCYGYLREIEVLYDYILNLIIYHNYQPEDIIVMVSDIDIYCPFIKGVFSNSLYSKYLPFHIMGKQNVIYNELLDIFMYILNIVSIDFSANMLSYFLQKDIILKKFDFNYDELEIINNIINNIGLYHELSNIESLCSEEHDKLLINKINSILLGYAINDNFCVWNNLIPFSTIGNSFINNIIGKLSSLVYKIMYWKKKIKKEYNFSKCIVLCTNILSYLSLDIYSSNDFFLNEKFWLNLYNSLKISSFSRKINCVFFEKIILQFLDKKNFYNMYKVGCINFCSFISLRSMSFKIICLIGINEDVFPRNIVDNNSFDLMIANPEIGDRNKRDNDKYLFLECIIAAREKLYISFINFCLEKNQKKYPSILIDILFNYIKCYFINKKNFYDDIKINKSLNFIYRKHTQNVFDINNFLINEKYYFSFLYEWFVNTKKKKAKHPLNLCSFKTNYNNELYLNDIHYFWSNPIKYFFIKRLGVNFYISKNYLDKDILYDLNFKKFFFIRQKIIFNILKKNIYFTDDIYIYLQYFNLLPYGCLGKMIWEKEKEKISFLLKDINKFFLNNKIDLKFNLKFKQFILCGNITLYHKMIVKWIPKNINFIDILLLFIDHLIYCYLGNKNNSYLCGYNGVWYLSSLSREKSKFYLEKYILGYLYNLDVPLFFFPKICNLWFYSIFSLRNINNYNNNYILNFARRKIREILYGKNNYLLHELNNIYISRLMRDGEKININNIIICCEKWLLPIFKILNLK